MKTFSYVPRFPSPRHPGESCGCCSSQPYAGSRGCFPAQKPLRHRVHSSGSFGGDLTDANHHWFFLVDKILTSRYDGYVLDIPLSDGIEEFVSGIKRAASRRGEDLLLIQVLQLAVTAPKRLQTSDRNETWVAKKSFEDTRALRCLRHGQRCTAAFARTVENMTAQGPACMTSTHKLCALDLEECRSAKQL